MTCPKCGSDRTRVLETRPCKGDIVRKRACQTCGHRFSTAERITAEYLSVRKRDGRVEPFSRAKLVQGIIKAAGGHKISPTDVTAYVDRVVQILQPEAPNLPIDSSHIGDLVLQQLRNDDLTDVVRVRYAMVLRGKRTDGRGFRSLEDFETWLSDEYGEPRVASARQTPSMVIKRNGEREPFEPTKLTKSVEISAKGRASDAAVRDLAEEVTEAVRRGLDGQALVTTGQIAAEALRELRNHDQLAYLRYASIAKRYQSVDDFWLDVFGAEEPG